MKIGFDAKRIFHNATGLGNYSRSLVSNLQHFFPENQYHLFSPEVKLSAYARQFAGTDKYKVHVGKTRLKSYWRSFSVVKDLNTAGIELYHGLSNEIPHNLHKEGIKSVVSIHDLIFKIYPDTYSLSERLIYDRKFRHACNAADKIIAISENTKSDIIRFYQIDPAKIEVIYQPCNPIFYTRQNDEAVQQIGELYKLPADYFLYVGSVEKRKNLELIIEAYRLNGLGKNIPLVIVGKGGNYKQDCKKRISEYGLGTHFIWMDSLKNNEHLQALYQSAKALIYPSLYEGFGLPVAEALLSKTPVITARSSSLTEAGGPDALYIDPSSVEDLQVAMNTILHDTKVADRMKENGLAYAQQTFSAAKTTQQLMALYRRLV